MKNIIYVFLILSISDVSFCQSENLYKDTNFKFISFEQTLKNSDTTHTIILFNSESPQIRNIEKIISFNKNFSYSENTNWKLFFSKKAFQNLAEAYIAYNLEGRYSEWPTTQNKITDYFPKLRPLQSHTEIWDDVLRTRATVSEALTEDTILSGPNYWQGTFYRIHNRGDMITYTVRFKMMLEKLFDYEILNNDTICLIQILGNDLFLNDYLIKFSTPTILTQRYVLLKDLLPFGKFYYIDVIYRNWEFLVSPDKTNDSFIDNDISKLLLRDDNVAFRDVEVRIIWKSDSRKYRLYLDTIKVFDQIGFDLKNNPIKNQLIIDLVKEKYSNNKKLRICLSNPISYDQMFPLEIILSLINSIKDETSIEIDTNFTWNHKFKDKTP